MKIIRPFFFYFYSTHTILSMQKETIRIKSIQGQPTSHLQWNSDTHIPQNNNNTCIFIRIKHLSHTPFPPHRSQLVSPTTSSFVVFLLPVDASTEILSSQPCTVSYVKKEIAAIGVTLIAMGTMPQ